LGEGKHRPGLGTRRRRRREPKLRGVRAERPAAMPTKVHLSSEALNAAPWAAHLVDAFLPADAPTGRPSTARGGRSGVGAQPREAPRMSPRELEEEVQRETDALLAARAASSASASAAEPASASLIPTFFRPKKNDVGFLASELRATAHRVALQYKERGLLEDDELEDLWGRITDVIARRPAEHAPTSPSEAATNEAESRISYEELRVVRDDFAAALDAANPGGDGAGRVAHYFTAKTFARFARDAHGRINGRTFMEFVVRHVALTQSRINLGCHDSDADGWLTEDDLEAFVGRSVTTMTALQSLPMGFANQYRRIATRRFMFFNDPRRRGKARISALLASDALSEFNELHAAREDDPSLAKNWFSLASAQRVYKSYLDLDLDMNGTLSKAELKKYTVDPRNAALGCTAQGLTDLFVDRLFEEHSLKGLAGARRVRADRLKPIATNVDPFVAKSMEKRRKAMESEMDFHAFLDFVLAWSEKEHPASLAYLFRVLDVNRTGALTNAEIWTFLKSIHETWTSDPDNYDLNMLDVQDEIFDMVKPAEAGRITLEDLQRCGCAGTVIEILCDHTGFWRYDNRENLPHDDEEEEGEGEGRGEEDDDFDPDDPFTAPF